MYIHIQPSATFDIALALKESWMLNQALWNNVAAYLKHIFGIDMPESRHRRLQVVQCLKCA